MDAVPLVSVVMPVYQCDRYVGKAIKSILSQTFNDLELIIVCDEPSDDLRSILEDYKNTDNRVKIFYRKRGSVASARTHGARMSKGKYIASMDCDDESLPERIEKQVNLLDSRPGTGILGTWAEVIDEQGTTIDHFRPPAEPGFITWQLLFFNCIANSSVMVRREILEQADFYRDVPNGYPEDYDLWLRSVKFTQISNIQEPLIKYRRVSNSLSVVMHRKTYDYELRRMFIENLIGLKLDDSALAMIDDTGNTGTLEQTINSAILNETMYRSFVNRLSLDKGVKEKVEYDMFKRMIYIARNMRKYSLPESIILYLKSLKYLGHFTIIRIAHI
jgi:glycosyltransferase involved in cell wall biosynthesis